MTPGDVEFYRRGLSARRERLQDAIRTAPEPEDLRLLLGDVDAALHRLDEGTYGYCETCRGEIEAELLAADPLARFCLEDLSPTERNLLEEDLELASRIQGALLPPRSRLYPGWNIAYHYRPRLTVSGDYCDLVPGPGADDLALFVGDISGKGVAASILMAHLRAAFRTLTDDSLPLSALFARANRLFCESTLPNQFATAVGARFSRGGVEVCNAGHPPALIARDHHVHLAGKGGLPLGMFLAAEYECERIDLAEGDILVLYSDGLSEARDSHDELFGTDRVVSLVERQRQAPAEVILETCLGELAAFTAGRSLDDDLTILVARRQG